MKLERKGKWDIQKLYFVIVGTLLIALSFSSYLGFNLNENSDFLLRENSLKLKQSAPDYWPDSGWRIASPESQGMLAQKLLEIENYTIDQNIEGYMDSLLLIRNGYLVYESYPSAPTYDENTLHNLHSVTKAFTSALIGIAIEDGYIGGLNDYVLDYFPNKTFANMDSRKESITINDLLTMRAGLSEVYMSSILSSSDALQYILDQQMKDQPGTVYRYNGGPSHLLTLILDQITPNGTLSYAETSIFEPLNVSNFLWATDQQGVPGGGSGLSLTPRDMAKFGFLYLNNGKWNGVPLIPSQWISESTKSYHDIGSDPKLGTVGYGYYWHIFKGINSYAIPGAGTQLIVVIPSSNIVVISTGSADFLSEFVSLLVDYIIPSVLDTPPDFVFEVILVISLVSIGVFTGLILYRIRNKRAT
ncbi:MAG: serine hydrolase domain-containing protein [Promethearchaeota archaeon]|jgi:CubicO group peptidase (beta-lactamase class C family)